MAQPTRPVDDAIAALNARFDAGEFPDFDDYLTAVSATLAEHGELDPALTPDTV